MGPAATAASATTSFSTAAAGSSSDLSMGRPSALVPAGSPAGLPPGWHVVRRKRANGGSYLVVRGPDGAQVRSKPEAWRRHNAAAEEGLQLHPSTRRATSYEGENREQRREQRRRQKQRRDARDARDGPHSASGGGAATGAKRKGAGAKQPVAATVQRCDFTASGSLGHELSAAAMSVSDEPTLQRVAEFVIRHGGPVTALVGWTVITKARTDPRGGLSRTWVSPDGERFFSMRKVWQRPSARWMR